MTDNTLEHELTDEELAQVLGGVSVGDVNIANITKSPIVKDNTVQALNGNTVTAVPYVPVSVYSTSV